MTDLNRIRNRLHSIRAQYSPTIPNDGTIDDYLDAIEHRIKADVAITVSHEAYRHTCERILTSLFNIPTTEAKPQILQKLIFELHRQLARLAIPKDAGPVPRLYRFNELIEMLNNDDDDTRKALIDALNSMTQKHFGTSATVNENETCAYILKRILYVTDKLVVQDEMFEFELKQYSAGLRSDGDMLDAIDDMLKRRYRTPSVNLSDASDEQLRAELRHRKHAV